MTGGKSYWLRGERRGAPRCADCGRFVNTRTARFHYRPDHEDGSRSHAEECWWVCSPCADPTRPEWLRNLRAKHLKEATA